MDFLDDTFQLRAQTYGGLFISLSRTGITFSKDVIEALGRPKFVKAFVSKEKKSL